MDADDMETQGAQNMEKQMPGKFNQNLTQAKPVIHTSRHKILNCKSSPRA